MRLAFERDRVYLSHCNVRHIMAPRANAYAT